MMQTKNNRHARDCGDDGRGKDGLLMHIKYAVYILLTYASMLLITYLLSGLLPKRGQ